MKNVNNLIINVQFPFINKEKKSYLTLIKRRNSSSKLKYFHSNEGNNNFINVKNNPIIRTILPFSENNKLLKSSSNNLYITKVPSEDKKCLKKNFSFEEFGTQIIPPYKGNIFNKKIKQKKIRYKELKYVGHLLNIEEKKNEKKIIKKYNIPLESRKDYFNFINQKRKLFFNPKATSNFVHEKSSNYLISTIMKSKSYSILYDRGFTKKIDANELLELRDKVPNIAFESEKMIKQIKNLFSQDFKFNNISFNEEFYKNLENKINFMEDIYRVPIIKNNLVKIKIDKNKSLGVNEWKNINVINHTTWNYLNQLKRKIQREKDEKEKKLKEYLKKKKEEEKEYEILQKKNKEKNKEKSEEIKTETISKDEEKLKTIMDDLVKDEENKNQKFEDIYSIEEYFLYKNIYFDDKVSIAPNKLRYVFFNNQ